MNKEDNWLVRDAFCCNFVYININEKDRNWSVFPFVEIQVSMCFLIRYTDTALSTAPSMVGLAKTWGRAVKGNTTCGECSNSASFGTF